MKDTHFYLSLFIVFFIIGSLPVLEKVTLGRLSPPQLAFLRGLSQTFFYGVLLYASGGLFELKTAPAKFVIFGLLQGVATAVMLYFYFSAMQHGEASTVKTLTSASPMLTYLLAIFFLKEPFSLERSIGILLVIAGIYLLMR
ncbi:protein of unknown function DUF6 transmembrane [Chloroherpeton thalassium ATCC 35110]|uniref:EamA domain-containing protein n=1 Tax=Chloroherpeton thalassium (strain ATCC 35110 / GB-78) TaxID=517418 RepID=B3QZ76_CHLT3|nr:EamA family transporter [Chloroherpeton thalassium]ACF13769.1 protein of unknown function DUF6 transmembrane [Chloroherpeton thalassium ATCC 35110]